MSIDDDIMETGRSVAMRGETLEEHAECVAEAIQAERNRSLAVKLRAQVEAHERAVATEKRCAELERRNELWAADYGRLMTQLQADADRLQRERDEARSNAKTLARAVSSMREGRVIRAYNAAIGYPDTRPNERAQYESDSAEPSDTVDIDR